MTTWLHAGAVAGAAIIANLSLAAITTPGVQRAIDTAILAVLVLLLDHLRERERRDRAAARRDKRP